MKFQKRRRSNNHGSPLNAAWVEKQRPEAEQESIKRRKIGSASPGAIDNQELLFHEQTVGDDGPRTPPGPRSLAIVVNKYARSINRSFMEVEGRGGCVQEQDCLSYRFQVIIRIRHGQVKWNFVIQVVI